MGPFLNFSFLFLEFLSPRRIGWMVGYLPDTGLGNIDTAHCNK